MKVENPGGTTNLFMTYTVISKHPIEQGSTHQSENYQVAQVCSSSKLKLIILKDFYNQAGFYKGLKLNSIFRIMVSEMTLLTASLR